MLHYQQFLLAGVAFLAVWYVAALQYQSKDHHNNNNIVLVTYAPIWLVILIGLYALFSVIYGTMTFTDTPEAAQELEQQIQEAQREMTKRGVITSIQQQQPNDDDEAEEEAVKKTK
jgi:biopolymer transport protein ExbB/TolQ